MEESRVTAKVIQVSAVVELRMLQRDAEVLKLVLGNVGGDPKGPRGSISRIYDALTISGVGTPKDVAVTLRPIYLEGKNNG